MKTEAKTTTFKSEANRLTKNTADKYQVLSPSVMIGVTGVGSADLLPNAAYAGKSESEDFHSLDMSAGENADFFADLTKCLSKLAKRCGFQSIEVSATWLDDEDQLISASVEVVFKADGRLVNALHELASSIKESVILNDDVKKFLLDQVVKIQSETTIEIFIDQAQPTNASGNDWF